MTRQDEATLEVECLIIMGVKILTINPVSYFIAVYFRTVLYDEHLDIVYM